MENKKINKIQKINIGKAGHFDIDLPLIRIGTGSPKVTILTGMHGDEFSGLLIIKKLLDKLELKTGTLQIILCANPIAGFSKTRESTIDSTDLNRCFPGNPNGTITERLANKLTHIMADSDLVIDIHNMQNKTKPTLLLISCNNKTDEKTIEIIKVFNAERVWKIHAISEEKYSQTLGAFLARQMIPHFAVEVDAIETASEDDINFIINGIENVLAKFKMVEKEIIEKELKYFKRMQLFSHTAGIFTPLKEVDEEIKEGEDIGGILNINEFVEEPVKCQNKGFVCDISKRKFVHEGEHIASIGEVIKE